MNVANVTSFALDISVVSRSKRPVSDWHPDCFKCEVIKSALGGIPARIPTLAALPAAGLRVPTGRRRRQEVLPARQHAALPRLLQAEGLDPAH